MKLVFLRKKAPDRASPFCHLRLLWKEASANLFVGCTTQCTVSLPVTSSWAFQSPELSDTHFFFCFPSHLAGWHFIIATTIAWNTERMTVPIISWLVIWCLQQCIFPFMQIWRHKEFSGIQQTWCLNVDSHRMFSSSGLFNCTYAGANCPKLCLGGRASFYQR